MKRRTALLTTLLTLAPTAAALACPYCKESIPSSDAASAASVPNGFNLSVYFMLVGFGVMLCSVAGLIVRNVLQTNATTVLPPGGFEPVTKDPQDPPKTPGA